MRSYSILLSAILASLALAEGADQTTEVGPVPKLKEAEFEKFVADNGLAMIKFFAPWCGHCKTMTEPYKLAGKQLKDLNIKAAVAEVDCTEEAKLCESYKIGGYPTLKIFEASKKEPTDYKGGRDTESIVNFLQKMTEPAVKPMKADELKKLVEENKKDVIVAGRFPKGHAAYAVFEKAAENFKLEFTFAHVESKDNTIAVHKTFDELEVKLEKPLDKVTAEELIAFVQTESMPLIDEVGFENYEKYIEANKPMAYLFYETEEQKKTYGAMLMKVMKPYKGKINTVYISVEKFGEHAPRINLEKHWPGFVIHDLEANNKFPLTGKDKPALTEKSLGDFVKQFVDGKLQPNFKSEATPEAAAQKEAKIKTVVRNNFEELVLDKNRDVFLEVSSPNCGFCERNKPKMDTLAEAFSAHSDKIVIARMNGMENDLHPKAGFELQYFPTYLLYKAGTNELVKFENTSGVKVEDFLKFVQENASNKVEIDLAKYKEAEGAKASGSESGASASGSDAGESSAGEHDEL